MWGRRLLLRRAVDSARPVYRVESRALAVYGMDVTEGAPPAIMASRLEFSNDPNAIDSITGVRLPTAFQGCPRCMGDHLEPLDWRRITRPIGFLGLTGRPPPPSMPPQFFAMCPMMAEPILYTNMAVGPFIL